MDTKESGIGDTLDALCAKAQAATPGPWEVKPYTGDSDPEYVGPIAGEEICTESGDTVLTQLGCSCCDFGLEGRPEDAAHIAAFDPPTVLALIERVRAAEAKLEKIREAVAGHPKCDQYEDREPVSCGWKGAYASVLRVLGEGAREENGEDEGV